MTKERGTICVGGARESTGGSEQWFYHGYRGGGEWPVRWARILIFSTDPTRLRTLSELFHLSGYAVTTASSESAAERELYQDGQRGAVALPDVILADEHLAGCSSRRLRDACERTPIPIVELGDRQDLVGRRLRVRLKNVQLVEMAASIGRLEEAVMSAVLAGQNLSLTRVRKTRPQKKATLPRSPQRLSSAARTGDAPKEPSGPNAEAYAPEVSRPSRC